MGCDGGPESCETAPATSIFFYVDEELRIGVTLSFKFPNQFNHFWRLANILHTRDPFPYFAE
jgi:hypothetical protein